jgi:hypothetical protein
MKSLLMSSFACVIIFSGTTRALKEGDRAVRIFRSAVAPKGQSIAIGGSVAQSGQTLGDSGAETHSIGLGCKVLFRRWSEVARGQSDLTTCFKHQCVRVGTLGSAPVY